MEILLFISGTPVRMNSEYKFQLKKMRNKLFICLICFTIIACRGQNNETEAAKNSNVTTFEQKQKTELSKISAETNESETNPNLNFRYAAKRATPGVVHIKSTYAVQQMPGVINDDFWYRFFYNGEMAKPQSDASGVIVSSDGYIATNDHVIEDAEDIEVILHNGRSYKAKIIGIDPQSDLALLKIDATDLQFIEFGNSDEVEVGDWVLAVGNPFNLTSTVTAGIVSAKARNINILKRKGAVESYIQTDAAINPGNSGGALVDYNGKLVGINSAIATPTGAYAGYSFATPVNIVKKILDDLLESGKVRRGYLGAVFRDAAEDPVAVTNKSYSAGVYIDSIVEGGAAMLANLKKKDIITAIDNHKIETSTQMHEILEQHRPGEKIVLGVLRNGNETLVPVTLKDFESTVPKPAIIRTEIMNKLGIRLESLSKGEKRELSISSGLRVAEVDRGKIYMQTSIRKGFIITKINGKRVNSEEEFLDAFDKHSGSVMLEGIYPGRAGVFYYAFEAD
jgi:serine protease Do